MNMIKLPIRVLSNFDDGQNKWYLMPLTSKNY